ncbi:sensor histidine kinase [Pseudolysinimonas yzui]|uniref:histidine kinase n=1 Tax=Pseudolysinimonas yzui TaxID=2708254 RepID=A0A8J3LZU3_9MICO|nr:ATP-binding protein [Pseudolysinimonas yzui]GHF06648.1 two-component sensor histidine kinase [Pseudolysinimonas yzui]
MKRWSLGTRLVVGIVGLLTVLAIAIAVVTVAASRGQQVTRLDSLLAAAAGRSSDAVDAGFTGPAPIIQILPGQGAGAVGMVITADTVYAGYIGTDGDLRSLDADQLVALDEVPEGGDPVTVDLGDLGDYRVVSTELSDGRIVVNGLSLAEADAATASLIQTIAAVSLAAIALALALGALVVRVALRPLTGVVETASRVSELPLETGAVSMPERVPVDAPDTEVGQVGTALNRLLGKVETSLAVRHESEQKLRRFVADASHELRTPLASIRGYAELGQRPARLPADTARSLERIESESVRMSTLVEEMLLLARLDAGRDLRAEPVALGALLVETVSDAHVAGPDHHWDLELPPDDIEVRGDPDRLRQALGNLLANARVHTPPGTTVTVALAPTEGGAAITVTDDGPGIDADLQHTLFERFTRGDDSRSRVAGSTGLGLAIVAAIVGAHDGTVTVESVPGRTVFRIELPRDDGSPDDPELPHS